MSMAGASVVVGRFLGGGHLGLPSQVHPGWMLVGSTLRRAPCRPVATALQPAAVRGWSTACEHGNRTSRATSRRRRRQARLRELRRQGETTVVFVPIDTIVHSRAWKGAGALPRPALPRGHDRPARQRPVRTGRSIRRRTTTCDYVADTIAVLDELGIEQRRAGRHLLQRVAGAAHRGPPPRPRPGRRRRSAPWARDFTPPLADPARGRRGTSTRSWTTTAGWSGCNRHYLPEHWPEFAAFFFDEMLPEPHSTKQLEDIHGFDCDDQRARDDGGERELQHPRYARGGRGAPARRSTSPVLVIQGTDDRCQPQGRGESVVRLDRGEHLVLEGAGHLPMARHPVVVNRAIKRFVDRVTGRARRDATPRCRDATPVTRALPVARRSVSGTCAATSRSPTRCARSDPTSRSSG